MASANRARIDASIRSFGQPTRSPGELTHLARVDHRYGQALGGQSRHYRALEATSSLKDHQHRVLLEEARDQVVDPGLVMGDEEDILLVAFGFAPS